MVTNPKNGLTGIIRLRIETKLERNKIYKVLKYFYSLLHKAGALKCNEFLAEKSYSRKQ